MAKPLVQRKSTVKTAKSKRKKVPKGASDDFQPVTDGGNIRRIVFEGEELPEPEPVPEPAPASEPVRDFEPVRRSSRTDMRSLHSEIDHLTPVSGPARIRSMEEEEEPVTRYVSDRPASTRYDERAIDALLDRVHFRDQEPEPEPEPEPAPEPEPKKAPAKKKPTKKPAKKAPAKKKPAPKKETKPAPKPPAKKKAAPKRKTLPYDYKGDVHFVVDLEGIGPTYEKKLHAAKIYNTQELLFTGDKRLQNVTGAPAKTIRNWKDMCQLVKVKGIGPQFAELMVRSGIHDGIDGLKTMDPQAALNQIKGYEASLKSKVTGSGIGIKRLTAWKEAAQEMRKVPIDLKKLEPIALESRQAIGALKDGEKKKPSASKKAVTPTATFPKDLATKSTAKKPAAKKPAAKKAPAKKPAPKKAAASKTAAKPAAKKAPAKKAAAKTTAKPAAKKAPVKKPAAKAKATTCAAKTASGSACKNAPRARSKYCASHKGYRP